MINVNIRDGFIANFLFWFSILILTYLRNIFLHKLKKLKLASFLTIITILILAYIYLIHTFSNSIIISSLSSLFFLLFIIIITYLEFSKFYSIGINNVDAKIRDGFDYTKALKECKNSMKFLGLAASKLTMNKEFEKAITRCSHSEIKLLLLKPTSKLLVDTAKKANVNEREYKRKSIESLRKIRDIVKNRAINIRVRFYEEMPVFRLMFIDSHICLMSYYVLGEGDGSQLPQLQLVNNPKKGRNVDYLYFAFETHFNQIWDKSEEWDLNKYVR